MTVFDSKLVIAGGLSGEVRLVNLSTGNCVHMVDSHVASDSSVGLPHINKLGVHSDNLLLCGNPWIRLVSLSTLSTHSGRIFQGHSRNVTCVDFQADAKWFLSAGEDGSVRLWDLRAKGFQMGMQHSCSIADGQLHANQGAFLFGDSQGFVNEWDLAANQIVRKKIGSAGITGLGVHALCLDKRLNLVCAHNNREISVFDLQSQLESDLHSFVQDDAINVRIYGDESPRMLQTPPAIASPLAARVISAKSYKNFGLPPKVIAPQSDILVSQSFGAEIHSSSYISSLRLSQTSQSLAVASGDGTISVWRTLDEEGLWTLDTVMKESADGITQSKWSWDASFVDPDERFVLSAHSDGVCKLWDTARHVPTPIAAYDCGGGKTVKSMVVLDTDAIDPCIGERRHRAVK